MGPIAIRIDIAPPDDRRRDCDNVQKAVLDALQHAGVFWDDSQVVWLLSIKHESRPSGGIRVQLDDASFTNAFSCHGDRLAMSQLTRFQSPIVRHIPSLNLVVRFDDSGIAIRAYRCRQMKRVTWAQLATLADETEPVVQICEIDHGSRVLKAMGVRLPLGETK